MSIRLQLLIVALTTLILPWAGCQYARELESALLMSQEAALEASADTIAHALAARLGPNAVLPHHGSLSRTLRLDAETRRLAFSQAFLHPPMKLVELLGRVRVVERRCSSIVRLKGDEGALLQSATSSNDARCA